MALFALSVVLLSPRRGGLVRPPPKISGISHLSFENYGAQLAQRKSHSFLNWKLALTPILAMYKTAQGTGHKAKDLKYAFVFYLEPYARDSSFT